MRVCLHLGLLQNSYDIINHKLCNASDRQDVALQSECSFLGREQHSLSSVIRSAERRTMEKWGKQKGITVTKDRVNSYGEPLIKSA